MPSLLPFLITEVGAFDRSMIMRAAWQAYRDPTTGGDLAFHLRRVWRVARVRRAEWHAAHAPAPALPKREPAFAITMPLTGRAAALFAAEAIDDTAESLREQARIRARTA
jgi:hypothetical protein